jgi:hypothetical protein
MSRRLRETTFRVPVRVITVHGDEERLTLAIRLAIYQNGERDRKIRLREIRPDAEGELETTRIIISAHGGKLQGATDGCALAVILPTLEPRDVG